MSARKKAKEVHWYVNDFETHFHNVDFDVWSRRSLKPLVDALGESVFLLHEGWEGTRYGAHMEVHSYNTTAADVNDLIREFVKLIDSLPTDARKLWDSAQRREFNIGMTGGFRPHSFEMRLDPDVLSSAVRLKAGVVMTIYATGRHFSGRTGEPPQRVMEPGSHVGPSPQDVMKAMRRRRKPPARKKRESLET